MLVGPQVPSCWNLQEKQEGTRSSACRFCTQWQVQLQLNKLVLHVFLCPMITTTFPSSALVTDEVEMGTMELTFDLPGSPLLKQSAPVLLLALEAPPGGENLAVTFSSQSLQPDVQVTTQLKFFFLFCPDITSLAALSSQSVCITEETSYVLLTGRQNVSTSLRISAAATSPHLSTTTASDDALNSQHQRMHHPFFFGRTNPEGCPDWWKTRKWDWQRRTFAFLRRQHS